MIRTLLLLIFAIAGFAHTTAQPYCDVRTFSLYDGLTANIISRITQTSDDLMWFGTWNGLCYFDGYRFTTFRGTPGGGDMLSNNRILYLEPNTAGNLWVITYDRRLYLFDTHLCQYVDINALIASRLKKPAQFRWIYSLDNGTTWVTGEHDTGLTLRIDDKGYASATSDEERNGSITIYNDFPKQKAMQEARGGKRNPFTLESESRTFVDSRHRVWTLSATEGVDMRDGNSTYHLQALPRTPQELTTSSTPFFHEDEYGTVWMVPTGGTFCYYDEGSHTLVPYPLDDNVVPGQCIPVIKKYFVDSQNNLWFSGEHSLTEVNFRMRHVQRIVTTPGIDTRALCVDHSGNIWAGQYNGLLAVYDRNLNLKGYVAPSGSLQTTPVAFAKRVYTIFEDKRGRIWVGGKESGLYCIDGTSVRHFSHDTKDKWSLSNDNIYDICEDTRGRLWVATYGQGVNLVEEQDGKTRFINGNNLLRRYPREKYQFTRRVTHTAGGDMIVATTDGIVTFSDRFSKPQDIQFHTSTHISGDTSSLAGTDVLQTLVSRSGTVYVCTMRGYLQTSTERSLLHDNLKFKTIGDANINEGLIQSIVEDGNGNIWLVREGSIDKYSPYHGGVAVYNAGDIGSVEQFSEAKPVWDAVGQRLLVGCNGCFLAFKPGDMVKSRFVPKIIFTAVQYQGDTESHSLLNIRELRIPSNKRTLTISFSALDYSDNRHIRYAYMLEGSDEKWTYVDNGHSASLSHIPHGHLRLLVRSTNADGVWQNNIRALNIYAEPTFWESWMGWLLYIIIGGGLVFIAFYLYGQKKRIQMQTEMREMMTTFFTNIGHKLRTPLTLIGGPVTEVMKSEKLSDRGQELLSMVRRNSDNMLTLVNKMLDYDHNPDNYLVDDNVTKHINGNDVPATEAGTTPTNSDVKLLVVEDTRDLRQFLFTILSSDYSVIAAENGQEGLEKARSEMPDFIITDVMMPVMDGMTMVHELKQDKNTSHIPIVILSAKASMTDRLQGLREGVDDYITKPFSATYLKERVANIIARRHSLQQDVLVELSQQGSKTKEERSRTEFKLSSPEIIDQDKVLMDKIMAFLEKHIGDSELKMDDIAQAVNLGRTAFYGKMKSIVGMPPVEFVRHIRLQRAEELITKSKDSFSQIAYAVGFTDPKYFSKCFRKETGMSPSEYRAKVKAGEKE